MENLDYYLSVHNSMTQATDTGQPTNLTESSKKLTNSAEKTRELVSSGDGKLFTPLTKKGAIKIVWVKSENIGHAEGKETHSYSSVYYTAHSSWFKSKEKELKSEVQKMKQIEGEIRSANGGSTEHLALDTKEMGPQEQIGGSYTVEVPKAIGDFESLINENQNLPLKSIFSFGGQFIDGLKNLHLAGYAYGDMKPENILVYEKKEGDNTELAIKISDFGKAQNIKDETATYKGNTRFAPPEGVLSKKGDIYSGALVLIRNFESKFLTDDVKSLIKVPENELDLPADDHLVGIERYVVENKAFPVAANSGSLTGTLRRYQMGKLSAEQMDAQSHAVHQYIDVLIDRLKNEIPENKRVEAEGPLSVLSELLKSMTDSDPSKRPTAEHCEILYRNLERQINLILSE